MSPATRAARHGFRRISYKEDDTTSGSDDEDLENTEVAASHEERARTARSSSRREALNSSAKKRKAPRPCRSTPVDKANLMAEPKWDYDDDHPVLQLAGKIPCWQNLPYHILHSIFQLPALKRALTDRRRSWLVQVALLCKSFVEPALSALYYTLALSSIKNFAKLLDLLQFQRTDSYLNYRNKVKWLLIEAPGKFKYKHSLSQILACTPQLRGIQMLNHGMYLIDKSFAHLAANLEANHISLRNWIFMDLPVLWKGQKTCERMYPTASRQTLESVDITHVIKINWKPQELAMAVNELPRLKHFAFDLDTLQDPAGVLSLLSVNLESLSIWGCAAVSPDKLAYFLAGRGRELRDLSLYNLSPQSHPVMANLAGSCPQLQDLQIHFIPSGDALSSRLEDTPTWPSSSRLDDTPTWPSSSRLDDMPTWPSSLQRLSLQLWGKWTIGLADMFFSSLIDSAASLTNLRYIYIRASLDESGWKSRVYFREKWTRRLSHVFLRRSEPPNPYLQSLGAYQAFKIAQENLARKSIVYDSHPATQGPSSMIPCKSSNLLNDIGNEPGRPETNIEPLVDKCPQQPGGRRSHRLRQQSKNKQRSSPNPSPPIRHRRRRRRRARESDSDSFSEDSASEDEVEREPDDVEETYENLHVQGLCDVVTIIVDNLRPSDEQLRESDFLNEEVSGDEDWNDSS